MVEVQLQGMQCSQKVHVINYIKDMPQIEQNKMEVYTIRSKSIILESLSLDYARHKNGITVAWDIYRETPLRKYHLNLFYTHTFTSFLLILQPHSLFF